MIESTYHQSPLVVAMQRTSLRVRAFDRASRSDTLLPIQASDTSFRPTTDAHQNSLTMPHHAPVMPIPKGRAIEVRGHRAVLRPIGELREVSYSERSPVTARALADHQRLQPLHARRICLRSAVTCLLPPSPGRERPVSRTTCKGLDHGSERVDGECKRCLAVDKGAETDVVLWQTS